MKQLQRLLIQQGNKCFFCGGQIPAGEASVEHLDAVSNGGEKTDPNCVACCRAINTALGNLTIKEMVRAILSHPTPFPCPHLTSVEEPAVKAAENSGQLIERTLDVLRRHGDKAPCGRNTLFNAVRVEVPDITEEQFLSLFSELVVRGVVSMSGVKVLYPGLASEA